MASDKEWKRVPSDIDILRRLATRIRGLADSPLMAERRRLWKRHNDLDSERPMILAETSGVIPEILPTIALECREEWARNLEFSLRMKLFQHERVDDDSVIEPYLTCGWQVRTTGYGVEAVVHRPDTDGSLGARTWDAPISDLRADFHRLKPREFSVDRDATLAWKAHLEAVFAGILPVQIRNGYGSWTMGMTIVAIDLIGLENLMLFMYDDPEGLHRLMGFLRDDHLAYLQFMESEGLLTLNNEADYVGSGSVGYTSELPQSDWHPGMSVRLADLWVLAESQETVGVGPEQFAEFIFPYQQALAARFGLTYYGCCEPVHTRWHVIRQLANLRKISISPWCDQPFMAAALGRDYIFARKPNPTLVSTERFDENAIRCDIQETLTRAHGCHVELVMKDVHTLKNQLGRLGRWVTIAREVIEEIW